MKCVMFSVRPKWCELIASGKKTIEVRKTKPKTDTPFKCYIYQTRKPVAVFFSGTGKHISEYDKTEWYNERSGKVIGEFVCDKIIDVDCDSVAPFDRETKEYVESKICFGREEFIKYAGLHCAYGWHISDLKIYDEPKELGKFGIKRPPQSWCYVEEIK